MSDQFVPPPNDSGGGDVPSPENHATTQPHPMDAIAAKFLAKCYTLAKSSNILEHVVAMVRELGIIGEETNAKLLYLVATTRLFKQPVSVLVKGPSSSGKSVTTQTVLKLFPVKAYYELTSMSDKALVYLQEPMKHRVMAIYEVAGLSEMAQYFVRSLISEGHIRYRVTTKGKGKGGFTTHEVSLEGPTGLVMTTTEAYVHPENETRMLSLMAADSTEQTRQILFAQALSNETPTPDLEAFHSLQSWVAVAERRVAIPYGPVIATLIPPTDLRVRRDFPTVLSLIKAHAMLHQLNRERLADGTIVASLEDYAVVRDLVNEVLSDGLDATVKPEISETVKAVDVLSDSGKHAVMVTEVAEHLELHKSSASRRIHVAIQRGYLVNEEWRPNRPAKLKPGIPLPKDIDILPSVESVVNGCAVASIFGGTHHNGDESTTQDHSEYADDDA